MPLSWEYNNFDAVAKLLPDIDEETNALIHCNRLRNYITSQILVENCLGFIQHAPFEYYANKLYQGHNKISWLLVLCFKMS